MIISYLNILQDSLIKKLELLEQIEKKSLEQAEMIKDTNVNLDLVDANMDEKAKLIDEIFKLDRGFESIYEKVREELIANKEQFKTQIHNLQAFLP